MPASRQRCRWWVIATLATVYPTIAPALTLTVKSAAVNLPGVALTDVHFEAQKHARLRIGSALLSVGPALRNITIDCADFQFTSNLFTCKNGTASAQIRQSVFQAKIELHSDLREAVTHVRLRPFTLGKGTGELRASFAAGQWSANGLLEGLALAELTSLAAPSVEQTSGELDIAFSYRAAPGNQPFADLQLTGRDIGFSNTTGTLAGEKLDTRLTVRWSSANEFTINSSIISGGLYAEPVFLSAPAPLNIEFDGETHNGQVRLRRIHVWKDGMLSARGTATVSFAPFTVQDSDLHIDAQLPNAFNALVQPFLSNEWQTSGQLTTTLKWHDDRPQRLRVDFGQVDLHIENRATLSGIAGAIDWSANATRKHSAISWKSGALLGARIGAAMLPLNSENARVTLTENSRIPIFDGALNLATLQVAQTQSGLDWHLSGALEPISMAALSAALGWPKFSGVLAGKIPDVRYSSKDQQLNLSGTLLAQAFDGDITVSDLALLRPLSNAPELRATIGIDGLDLRLLTEAFSFARIEGRLDGFIRDLILRNWHPESFSAKFHTPENDRSKRRISQQAVEAISALGGNDIGSVLSRGLIGLFNEFRYSRLGAGCNLRNRVCDLSGVAAATGDSFYLVEGSGIPRIDVIGYNQKVDWQELIKRLKMAANSDAPVVR